MFFPEGIKFLGHIFSENWIKDIFFLKWILQTSWKDKSSTSLTFNFTLYFRVLLIKFILSNFRSTNINLLFETRNLHSRTIVRGTLHQSTLDLSIIKCTPGSNVFSRTEQKHGCSGFSFQLIKTSTGTFTGEEAIEFQTFQRNRFCNSVQRPVHT